MPYLVQESHFALLGFAPKQNFAFAMDSGNRKRGLKDALLHPILLHFALSGYKRNDDKGKESKSIYYTSNEDKDEERGG